MDWDYEFSNDQIERLDEICTQVEVQYGATQVPSMAVPGDIYNKVENGNLRSASHHLASSTDLESLKVELLAVKNQLLKRDGEVKMLRETMVKKQVELRKQLDDQKAQFLAKLENEAAYRQSVVKEWEKAQTSLQFKQHELDQVTSDYSQLKQQSCALGTVNGVATASPAKRARRVSPVKLYASAHHAAAGFSGKQPADAAKRSAAEKLVGAQPLNLVTLHLTAVPLCPVVSRFVDLNLLHNDLLGNQLFASLTDHRCCPPVDKTDSIDFALLATSYCFDNKLLSLCLSWIEKRSFEKNEIVCGNICELISLVCRSFHGSLLLESITLRRLSELAGRCLTEMFGAASCAAEGVAKFLDCFVMLPSHELVVCSAALSRFLWLCYDSVASGSFGAAAIELLLDSVRATLCRSSCAAIGTCGAPAERAPPKRDAKRSCFLGKLAQTVFAQRVVPFPSVAALLRRVLQLAADLTAAPTDANDADAPYPSNAPVCAGCVSALANCALQALFDELMANGGQLTNASALLVGVVHFYFGRLHQRLRAAGTAALSARSKLLAGTAFHSVAKNRPATVAGDKALNAQLDDVFDHMGLSTASSQASSS